MTHFDPGADFRALHQPGNPFILANAWDRGSAKMLAALGAKALATSSGAHAFTLGFSCIVKRPKFWALHLRLPSVLCSTKGKYPFLGT